jgi:hypothetical protein
MWFFLFEDASNIFFSFFIISNWTVSRNKKKILIMEILTLVRNWREVCESYLAHGEQQQVSFRGDESWISGLDHTFLMWTHTAAPTHTHPYPLDHLFCGAHTLITIYSHWTPATPFFLLMQVPSWPLTW